MSMRKNLKCFLNRNVNIETNVVFVGNVFRAWRSGEIICATALRLVSEQMFIKSRQLGLVLSPLLSKTCVIHSAV